MRLTAASLLVAVLACPLGQASSNTVHNYLLQQQQLALSPLFPNPKQPGVPWMKVGVKSPNRGVV